MGQKNIFVEIYLQKKYICEKFPNLIKKKIATYIWQIVSKLLWTKITMSDNKNNFDVINSKFNIAEGGCM